ncbi:unnamed protein product [Boreogadus saida]
MRSSYSSIHIHNPDSVPLLLSSSLSVGERERERGPASKRGKSFSDSSAKYPAPIPFSPHYLSPLSFLKQLCSAVRAISRTFKKPKCAGRQTASHHTPHHHSTPTF